MSGKKIGYIVFNYHTSSLMYILINSHQNVMSRKIHWGTLHHEFKEKCQTLKGQVENLPFPIPSKGLKDLKM